MDPKISNSIVYNLVLLTLWNYVILCIIEVLKILTVYILKEKR